MNIWFRNMTLHTNTLLLIFVIIVTLLKYDTDKGSSQTGAMASQTCGTCKVLQRIKPAEAWCPQCEEFFCKPCSRLHRLQTSTRGHVSISCHELPAFILNVQLFCKTHRVDSKYTYYCKSHDCPLCNQCLSESHTHCDSTPEVYVITDNIKTSAYFENEWEKLEAKHKVLMNVIKDGKGNLDELERQRENITTQVKERTQKLTDQLKELENKTLSEIDSIINKIENDIKDHLKVLEEKENNLGEMLDKKDSITKYASNYHTFAGMKQIGRDLQDSEEILQQLTDDTMVETQIQIEKNIVLEEAIYNANPMLNIRIKRRNKTNIIDN